MATHGGATRTRANDPLHRDGSIGAGGDGDDASMWPHRASSWVTTTTTGDSRANPAKRSMRATTPSTVALTVGLSRTYQGINARYYEVGSRAVFGRRVRSTATRGARGLDLTILLWCAD